MAPISYVLHIAALTWELHGTQTARRKLQIVVVKSIRRKAMHTNLRSANTLTSFCSAPRDGGVAWRTARENSPYDLRGVFSRLDGKHVTVVCGGDVTLISAAVLLLLLRRDDI
jgi:hypothetical protein